MTTKSNYGKSYYENNKEKILEKMFRPKVCDVCQCEVAHCYFNKHTKTKKHLANACKQKPVITSERESILQKEIQTLKDLLKVKNT